MPDLMECLYHFAMEHRVDRYLNEPEYSLNAGYGEERLQWLRRHLDGEALEQLEDFCRMQELERAEWEAALFRAGFAMGAELARG